VEKIKKNVNKRKKRDMIKIRKNVYYICVVDCIIDQLTVILGCIWFSEI